MTVTPNSPASFGGHTFLDGKFSTPVYFEGDDGLGAGAGTPDPGDGVVDTGVSDGGAPADTGTPDPAVVDTGTPVADPDDGVIPEALKPYFTKLRDEAAERRVAIKPYEDAFSGFEDADREALLAVVTSLASEDTQTDAARQLKALAEAILGDEDDPDRPLTRADLERIETEKQTKAKEEQAVQAVIKEAVDLGYPEGTRNHRHLFDVALNEFGGDLTKAHEAMQTSKDAIIAEYAKQVQEGKAKWPTLAPPVGGTPADTTGQPPKTFAEASAAAIARAKAAANNL